MKVRPTQSKASVAITGALLLVLGAVLIANPGRATVFVTRIVGWAIAIGGVAVLVSGFAAGGATPVLVAGGLALALGIVIVANPVWFADLLLTLLGIVIVVSGVGDIARAGRMRSARLPGSEAVFAIGLATLLVGGVVVVAPFLLVELATVIAGIGLAADGISELFLAWRM